METVSKRSASGTQTTMICLMPSAQNAATQTATHSAIHADITFPTKTTSRHASLKSRDTKMKQQSRKKLEVKNGIASTTHESDGVVGLIKS